MKSMSKQVSKRATIGIAMVVGVLLIGLAWFLSGASGAGATNPNAGHASAHSKVGLSDAEFQNLDAEGYATMLKDTRPDLSDAERHSRAERWFKLKHR